MSACHNCGQPIQSNKSFCNNCGAKIAAVEPQTRTGSSPTKSLSKPVKWSIISILVLAVGLFAAHLYLSSVYKPEAAVAAFEKAVNQKDYPKVRSILENGGTDSHLTDDELKGFVTYLTKEHDFKSTMKELQRNAAGMKHYKRETAVEDDNNNKMVMLVKGPKKFFFYHQYAVKAFPFTVSAISNLENTKVDFNGQSKVIKSSDEEVVLGKILPGDLSLTSAYKGKYVTLKSTTKVDFSEASNNQVNVGIDLEGKYISIYSNGDGADIYINGKKSGLKTGSYEDVGPIATDGSVEVYAVLDRDSGPIKSNVVKIEDEGEVNLEFKEIAQEQEKAEQKDFVMTTLAMYGGTTPKEQMYNFMNEFISTSVRAFNNRDFGEISSYLAPDGPGYAETEKYIQHLADKGITEDLVKVEILDVQATDKGFKVKTREEYNIHYPDKPSKNNVYESAYTIVATEFGLSEYSLDSTKTIKSEDLEDYE